MNEFKWYMNAVFYEIYLRSFKDSNNDGIGDLPGLLEKLEYIKQLGIDCIWLLPIYPSPRKDDGYDIADYYSIDADYGTINDFKQLVEAVHKNGMHIVMDLVVNHTSDQHPWFQSSRSDPNSPYRDYYVWSDTDQKYPDARIIFVDTEKSNWTWDEKANKYYWHRFYSSQPDLNYENPAVRSEMLKIIQYWLDLGIDGFRVDAVPYLFEKDGTNCENLPETHNFLKEIRRLVEEKYPGRILFCEANQKPEDVVKYFGNGDEFHLAFHFPLMPKIFIALRSGNKTPIEESLEVIPAIPENCQWGTFLRNHDELTLEMITPAEREWMWREYAPEPRMRLNLGIRRRLAPLLDDDESKIKLAYNILFSLPGSPFIYYGDEIGMGDDLELPDRDGVRTPMQWDDSINGGFSGKEKIPTPVISENLYSPKQVNVNKSVEVRDSIWNQVRELIDIRKKENIFRTSNISILESDDSRVLIFMRKNENEKILFAHNLSSSEIKFQLNLRFESSHQWVDLLTQKVLTRDKNYFLLSLKPYQSYFLKSLQH